MSNISYDTAVNQFRGECPRCGHRGFYKEMGRTSYGANSAVVLLCSGGHMFYLEHATQVPSLILDVGPVENYVEVPAWMPTEYHSAYKEMLDAHNRSSYRSVVGVAAIILDAYFASLLPNEGDRKKPLFQKIEAARNLNKIDHDQFSDATIARLTRNEILHPDSILEEVKENESKEIVESVTSLLERAFKFRNSRALPAGQLE